MTQRSTQPADVLPPVNTRQEPDMMIAEKPGIRARQWLRERRMDGHVKGQADLLLDMLQRRFDAIPSDEAFLDPH